MGRTGLTLVKIGAIILILGIILPLLHRGLCGTLDNGDTAENLEQNVCHGVHKFLSSFSGGLLIFIGIGIIIFGLLLAILPW